MKTTGVIKRIIGPVVDVVFEGDVPNIYSALTVKKEFDDSAGSGTTYRRKHRSYCGYGFN